MFVSKNNKKIEAGTDFLKEGRVSGKQATQKEFLARTRKRDLIRANSASPNLLRVIGFNIYLFFVFSWYLRKKMAKLTE